MLTETVNMAHLGARAFEEIGGEVVQTTSFVRCANHVNGYKGTYCRLIEPTSQQGKEDMFLAGENRYTANQDDFAKIPGAPIAYWIGQNVFRVFSEKCVRNYAEPRHGMSTGNNDLCLKVWFEISEDKVCFDAGSLDEFDLSKCKYAPYKKGGSFRLWYGNNDYVIAYDKKSRQVMEKLSGYRSSSTGFFFKPSINWSDVSTSAFGMRVSPKGFAFDGRGASMFCDSNIMLYIAALLASKFTTYILNILNPTLTFNIENVAAIPVIIDENQKGQIECTAEENVQLSKDDWDSFETSWDFKKHPLLCNVSTISEAFAQWQAECAERFNQLKANEEELNRIFIDIYGLQDELTPEVEEKDVTVRKADLQRDIKSLLSYAVGCMFGRYSLDVEGLAYAGGEWDNSKYQSYIPDADNVIPITDEEYLDDDIVSRLCAWLKVVYGADTLEENLDYIAKALGNKGSTSREIIRNYFLNDFFKDHCQTYSVTGSGKRPIYWLFDSGKQNGFKALVYLHRYTPDTIGNLRIDYLHKMQRVYESEINRMQDMMDHSENAREVAAASKRKDKLAKQLKECREYDEKISHLALSRIELDLDDGVKVNYRKLQTAQDGKFYEVLADSKNIMVKEKK